MTSFINFISSGVITTSLFIAIDSFGIRASLSQDSEYRLPPVTPVTCKLPQRKEIYNAGRSFYLGEMTVPTHGERYWRQSDRWSDLYAPWISRCWELCDRARPIPPEGYGWLYSGRYGRTEGAMGCIDKWIKLIRKDGDRVNFEIAQTNRMGLSSQAPSKYRGTEIIKCTTRELWSEKRGWVPIRPYTIYDDGIDRFC